MDTTTSNLETFFYIYFPIFALSIVKSDNKANYKHWEVAGHINFPENVDMAKKYPAIVCVHPASSVKEQTDGLYAMQLAISRAITLTFDVSFKGDSGGEPST